jgi:hypothetical protein
VCSSRRVSGLVHFRCAALATTQAACNAAAKCVLATACSRRAHRPASATSHHHAVVGRRYRAISVCVRRQRHVSAAKCVPQRSPLKRPPPPRSRGLSAPPMRSRGLSAGHKDRRSDDRAAATAAGASSVVGAGGARGTSLSRSSSRAHRCAHIAVARVDYVTTVIFKSEAHIL